MWIPFLSRMTLAGWRDTRAPFAQPIHKNISHDQLLPVGSGWASRWYITHTENLHGSCHDRINASNYSAARRQVNEHIKAPTFGLWRHRQSISWRLQQTNKQINKIYIEKKNLQADKSTVESNKMVGETKFRLCPVVQRLNPAHVAHLISSALIKAVRSRASARMCFCILALKTKKERKHILANLEADVIRTVNMDW